MTTKRIKLTVYGTVQGVGFRYHTRQKALDLGLTGYVRNRPDGTVEIVAEGDRTALEQLTRWAHEGSPAAQVSQVETAEQLQINRFETFVIDY
ncbi:MAG: acylphosphatase [Leptolyngbya sp. SIO4C1]|nr:acylphosphatase [Leptolyngbya sp. SIO4C1]